MKPPPVFRWIVQSINNMDLTIYNATSTSVNDTDSDETLIRGVMAVAFALGAASVMQTCLDSYVETQQSEKHVDSSAPSTPKRELKKDPRTPPPAPKRPSKKAMEEDEKADLDSRILSYLVRNPGATVKEMVKSFADPDLQKTNVNSRLYSLLHKKIVRKVGETGAPQWFLNQETSLAIVPRR